MPLQETSGNVTTDAYGGGKAVVPAYIEEVFSTYLYAGSSTTPQTITNGIDLSTKGGLVWTKKRDAAGDHALFDTARGSSSVLYTNLTVAADTGAPYNTSFNTNGFTFNTGNFHDSGYNYASWTFRKQPKFFDVVTYTGTGTDPLTLNHNLQSVPGCIIIKCTSAVSNWRVHSTALDMTLTLNTTNAGFTPDGLIKNLTSSTFQVNNSADVNSSGQTYVAYLFAHNAGGFGLTGTDNVISCGSFTTDASGNATVNLGYEPQWLLYKSVNSVGNWQIADTMRGFNQSVAYRLFPNSTAAEFYAGGSLYPTATGFQGTGIFLSSEPHIYIAIRRGPMKVPTSGTSVFAPLTWTGNNTTNVHTTGFPVDMTIVQNRQGTGANPQLFDRLRGMVASTTTASAVALFPNTTGVETGAIYSAASDSNTAWISYSANSGNASGVTYADWAFQRAPSFFDEVCYTYTSGSFVANHNLGVTPEMVILKRRDSTGNWFVYHQALGFSQRLNLNTTDSVIAASAITAATSTTFTTGFPGVGGATVVAYLFASCTGVSKVGSYTGNGSTQTINCGFIGGARFVLLKATSTTGNWMVYDTARGMTTLTDPFLSLNSTSAETATLGACTTVSTGFAVNESILAGVNTNGVSFVYLAIA